MYKYLFSLVFSMLFISGCYSPLNVLYNPDRFKSKHTLLMEDKKYDEAISHLRKEIARWERGSYYPRYHLSYSVTDKKYTAYIRGAYFVYADLIEAIHAKVKNDLPPVDNTNQENALLPSIRDMQETSLIKEAQKAYEKYKKTLPTYKVKLPYDSYVGYHDVSRHMADLYVGSNDLEKASSFYFDLFAYYKKTYTASILNISKPLWKDQEIRKTQISIRKDFCNAYDHLAAIHAQNNVLRNHYRAKANKIFYEIMDRDSGYSDRDRYYFLGYYKDLITQAFIDEDVDKIDRLYKEYLKNQELINPEGIWVINKGSMAPVVAEVYMMLGYSDKAKEVWDSYRSIFHDKDSISYLRMGILISFSQGDYEKALELWRDLQENDDYKQEKYEETRIQMKARIDEKLGNYLSALKNYQKLIKLHEQNRSKQLVSQNLKFFQLRYVLLTYEGIIRTYHALYKESKDVSYLEKMIIAAENLKARQLSDVLQAKGRLNIQKITIKSIQQKIKKEQVLLEYIDAGDIYYVCMITNKKIEIFEIPYSKSIENRIKTVHKALSNPSSSISKIEKEYKILSDSFVKPIRSTLKQKKSVLIVADGILAKIPFELFTSDENYSPLIRTKSIAYMPSIQYFIYSSKDKAKRKNNFFALANPVFANKYSVKNISSKELATYATKNEFEVSFVKLPETMREVYNIARYFPKRNKYILSGKRATATKVKRLNLSKYRYLHFATHGIIGDEIPGITQPALVLSKEKGKNSFLSVSDVEKMKLNADLTVLSACNTGSGKFVRGEGIMGLGRAFLSAGSDGVVMSLWPVPSQETVSLMNIFYKYLTKGENSVEALRLAKLDMIKKAQKSSKSKSRGLKRNKNRNNVSNTIHPFYWAPFIIYGR